MTSLMEKKGCKHKDQIGGGMKMEEGRGGSELADVGSVLYVTQITYYARSKNKEPCTNPTAQRTMLVNLYGRRDEKV